jgi:hypothetical protein
MSQECTELPFEHMRDYLGASSKEPLKVVDLGRKTAGQAKSRGAAALELVERAAEAINDIEARATETEARAVALARDAIEKLDAAEARIQVAEAAQRQVIEEATIRLRDATEELKRAEAHIDAAESEAAAAAARAQAAEAQAGEAEAALRNIEHAIRTKLLREERAAHLPAAA